MKSKKDSKEILNILRKTYPEATCSLDFETPFQIVIAVMLSAQCTDERVNKTTPLLFKDYGTPEKLSKIDIKKLDTEQRDTFDGICIACAYYVMIVKYCASDVFTDMNELSIKMCVPELLRYDIITEVVNKLSKNKVITEDFKLKKVDGDWILESPNRDVLEKIHGLYDYKDYD